MDIKSKIKEHIAKNILFNEEGFAYGDEASFLEQGIIDSIGFMELVAFVEKEYGIQVGAAELVPDNFDSVNKLARFVAAKQGNPISAA